MAKHHNHPRHTARPDRDHAYPKQFFHNQKNLWKSHRRGWGTFLVLLVVCTLVVKDNAMYLQSSLVSTPKHAPYDGAVYPVQEVPDWLETSADEKELHYDDFPESKLELIPTYTAKRLREDFDDLEWGDSYDDYTRQMKITYMVPYAGSYELDNVEGGGSHPGVDIVALKGTPVFSIMNGVVEKVQYSTSGFGNLVVIRHENVPDPDDKSKRVTLYSGYAHLDEILTKEGAVVTKGEQIGKVGETGTATTDHLHFQVDNADAPWHLYWPFTSAEANTVGGFFEAVNEGLNQNNVYSYTENPLVYVQKYMDPDATFTNHDSPVVSIEVTDVPDPVPVPESTADSDREDSDDNEENDDEDDDSPFHAVELEFDGTLVKNKSEDATLSVVDKKGELVKMPSYNSPIKAIVSDPEVLEVFPLEFPKGKFLDGSTEITLTGKKVGKATLTFEFLGETVGSFTVSVIPELGKLVSFSLESDGDFQSGQEEPIVIVALDSNGQRVIDFELPDILRLEVVQGKGSFSRVVLIKEDFEEGMTTVFFTATTDDPVVLRAYSGDIAGTSPILNSNLFSDLDPSHPYYEAIEYLKMQGVISGYPDGTFQPDRAVSRVEALKLIFAGLGKDLENGSAISFPDTESSAWYAPYVATAQRVGIVQGYPDGSFKPANEVNRVEFIKMLTATLDVDIDPVVIGDPYEDVNDLEWYAPYAQFVKVANLAPWTDGNLKPGTSMNRGEVAEMIYRVLAIQKNDTDKYSRTLVL